MKNCESEKINPHTNFDKKNQFFIKDISNRFFIPEIKQYLNKSTKIESYSDKLVKKNKNID